MNSPLLRYPLFTVNQPEEKVGMKNNQEDDLEVKDINGLESSKGCHLSKARFFEFSVLNNWISILLNFYDHLYKSGLWLHLTRNTIISYMWTDTHDKLIEIIIFYSIYFLLLLSVAFTKGNQLNKIIINFNSLSCTFACNKARELAARGCILKLVLYFQSFYSPFVGGLVCVCLLLLIKINANVAK